MRVDYDLAQLDWQLTGWHPDYWRGTLSNDSPMRLDPDVPAVPARVPGSVQQALRDAGLLPDWNMGLESRNCEWVEQRHWAFQTTLPEAWTRGPGRKVLECGGLDYQGAVLVNGQEAGTFQGTLVPHRFDLTGRLQPGENRLCLVFTGHPPFLGQIGWTSRITAWKTRFYYTWDWCPRLVQIGAWDTVRLCVDDGDRVESLSVYTEYDAATGRGAVHVHADLTLRRSATAEVSVQGSSGEVARRGSLAFDPLVLRLDDLPVQPWHPNGQGEQPLYRVALELLDEAGQLLDHHERQVGFRQVEWVACAGAPAEADPWICRVNGVDTFLRGFNWVPIRPLYADVTEAQYRRWLETYARLGTNLLRVWGGSMLERECFYRLCDELGLMVWQEFPLSSSGIDNWPPEDPEAIASMRRIAASYIRRRQHHPSLLLWCGGNELQGALDGGKQGIGRPVDATHPMMAAQQEVVARLDPARRFLPTSSSGPRFGAALEDFGRGLHYDVHGPWNHAGPLDTWRRYWDGDDALFRSETGMPGAGPAQLLRAYGGELAWPADKRVNPWYRHAADWWDQWDEYRREGGDPHSLDAYVAWSQERQAEALAYAARRCRERFPRMGGIMFWMGHDCFPCPVNTAVIDFEGNPKPAGEAIGRVFRGEG
ncbi:MAG: glycoside hydrolase family 2 TIM barrel-domain containing protein [Candidatus Latescibacterota bacterium]